jgi:hypothetical protein
VIERFSGRRLVAGVVALYALVVGLLLPLHMVEDREGAEERAPAGALVGVLCHDRGCHEPSHHHRSGHLHDAATCSSCAQARAAATPAPAAPTPVASFEARGPAHVETGDAPAAPVRRTPPARGPPTLLS